MPLIQCLTIQIGEPTSLKLFTSTGFAGTGSLPPNAKNCQPARHRTPGDIRSEHRARSSRNAWATSSESARQHETSGGDAFNGNRLGVRQNASDGQIRPSNAIRTPRMATAGRTWPLRFQPVLKWPIIHASSGFIRGISAQINFKKNTPTTLPRGN